MNAREPWTSLIDYQDIIDLHEEGISRYGGDLSPPHSGCLERSLGAAWYLELYATPEEARKCLAFASGLIYYLVKNHCFTDGNKRIAWMACMEVLRNLGLTVKATNDEAERLCLDIISGQIKNAIDVLPWIAQRLEEFPIV